MSTITSGTVPRPTTSRGILSEAAFWIGLVLVAGVGYFAAGYAGTDIYYITGYTVLQYVVLATAWNILGGYAGYVNFGSAGFFAIGCYSSVVVFKLYKLSVPIIAIFPLAAVVGALIGLGMGYLTLRLRGVFFSIATLALAVVLQTLVINWDFVNGARGVYIVRPVRTQILGYTITYTHYLFILMLGLAILSVIIARAIQKSDIGRGLAAIRDDELAAESCGVPALRLKLLATAVSGALMAMAGVPLPFLVTFLDPPTAFNLSIAVNTIAMPLIGGTATWAGPVIGAVLISTMQQWAQLTIQSAWSLMIVGVLLVIFVTFAPNGIVGLFQSLFRRRSGTRSAR